MRFSFVCDFHLHAIFICMGFSICMGFFICMRFSFALGFPFAWGFPSTNLVGFFIFAKYANGQTRIDDPVRNDPE